MVKWSQREHTNNTVGAYSTRHMGMTSRELSNMAGAHEPFGMATPENCLAVFYDKELKITHLQISLEEQKQEGCRWSISSKNTHLPRMDKTLGSNPRAMRKSWGEKKPCLNVYGSHKHPKLELIQVPFSGNYPNCTFTIGSAIKRNKQYWYTQSLGWISKAG